ncbi:hypothetical protein Q5752_001010 [Cryptotrichosporon argae]
MHPSPTLVPASRRVPHALPSLALFVRAPPRVPHVEARLVPSSSHLPPAPHPPAPHPPAHTHTYALPRPPASAHPPATAPAPPPLPPLAHTPHPAPLAPPALLQHAAPALAHPHALGGRRRVPEPTVAWTDYLRMI